MTEETNRPLGEWLRQRREELGLSLEDAQQATRIRIRHLEALEAEDLQSLPNIVVARGFLRNYATYLGLDPQEAASRIAALTGPAQPEASPIPKQQPPSSEPFQPVELHGQASLPARRWLAAVAAVVAIVALVVLVWWASPYISGWVSGALARFETAATSPVDAAGLATATNTPSTTKARPTASVTSPSSGATPTLVLSPTPTLTLAPSPSPTSSLYTGIFLELVFTDTSWVQVTTDGVRQFQGELPAGTYRSWYADQRLELRIGNAGAVEATINGEKLGAVGAAGEVIDLIFEVVDDQVAAATPTRAPTLAPAELTATAAAPPAPTFTPTSPATTPALSATITPTLAPTATASP